jgi:hypothetical protein
VAKLLAVDAIQNLSVAKLLAVDAIQNLVLQLPTG